MTRLGKGPADLTPVAALVEPLRQRLFLYVASATEPVGRNQAAAGLGIARSVAAFHLDKLADAGVLAFEYRRPPGRSGPGAGRPAKLYRPVQDEFTFSVPDRHYELLATVLAQAVADSDAESIPVAAALRKAARSLGRAIGVNSEESEGAAPRDSLERVADILTTYGYRPLIEPSRVTLVNCPYHALVEEHREVVCPLNLRLLKGVLKGAGTTDLLARSDPSPGQCCVTITARRPSARSPRTQAEP